MRLSRRYFILGLSSFTVPVQAQIVVTPEGGGDHTDMLQKAVEEARDNSGRVFLDAGKYNVTGLVVGDGVVLEGVPGRTVLTSADDTIIALSKGKRIGLKGLRFTSERDSADLVRADDVEDLMINECAFVGGRNGLSLQGCNGRVLNNRFGFQSSTGLYSNDATGLLISGNTLEDIENNGILVWRGAKGEDGTIVSNNRIARIAAKDGGTGENGNGINVFRAGNVVITGNRITDCYYSAIRDNAGDNCQITSNSVSRIGEVAIYVEFGFEGAVVANNMIDGAALGIVTTNFNNGGRLATISGNIIRSLKIGINPEKTQTVGIAAEADAVISNNVIEDVDVGINFGWGENCRNLLAQGNLVRKAKRGIAVSLSSGAGQVKLVSNQFDEVLMQIVGMDYDEAKTGDLLIDGSTLPANITLTR